jgi:hypothetical protein
MEKLRYKWRHLPDSESQMGTVGVFAHQLGLRNSQRGHFLQSVETEEPSMTSKVTAGQST